MFPVSILVVVESALREKWTLGLKVGAVSFNPCCSGIGSAGMIANRNITFLILCFNPCCSGIGSAGSTKLNGKPWKKSGFNPCCSGIGSAGNFTEKEMTNAEDVSILVVVESALRAVTMLLI